MKNKTDWQSLSEDELRQEAAAYRGEIDDGSTFFFDPSAANWKLQYLDPKKLGVFNSVEDAQYWLDIEMDLLNTNGYESITDDYEFMLENGVSDPIVVGEHESKFTIWDGYHRSAIAVIRGEPVLAIVGTKIALDLEVKKEPREHVSDFDISSP